MHIKQVTIFGFRSYKDQILVDPFSPQHNVVIGRNGTGKSNFFDAIQFGLLTSKFANLRQEERQALLHEGSGKHVMSAYVEIIFDNTDGRLPVDTEEVVLRRTIGVKKDEFFLNRKHIIKGDVIHLLESAGFSRSNPYYIVQQGKVNTLALMKDKDRLELLKEVAGTRVYEDRRQESLKILHDTESRREKIQEVIEYIEERLAELEEEKDELKEYQMLDKQKRALEYTMHEKELHDIRLELEEIENNRVEEATRSNNLHNLALGTHESIKKCESTIQVKSQELKALLDEKTVIEQERRELMELRYKLELEVKELMDQVCNDQKRHSESGEELKTLNVKIQNTERQLKSEILPLYVASSAEVKSISESLVQIQSKSDVLIAKQSRKSQFRNQEERDSFLKQEVSSLGSLISKKMKDIKSLEDSINSLQTTIVEASKNLRNQEEEITERKEALEEFAKTIQGLKEKRNTYSEERKEKWRKENEISQEVEKYTEQLSRGQSGLYGTMSSDLRRGLQAIKDMKASGRYRGIYGPLIELVEPEDSRFCTVVDEAAGTSLFNVIVDTDETATQIMKELDRKKLGRVTFLPLNRLKVPEKTNYPRNDDVIPLIEKLKYRPDIQKAVACCFGKKLICRDLRTCVQYAETSSMDCLTLDGDMVHRRGALNGGYKDPQRSRTRSMMEIRSSERKLEDIKSEAEKVKALAQQADQRVTSVLGEIQKQDMEKKRSKDTYEQLRQEHQQQKETIQNYEQNLAAKQELLASAKTESKELKTKLKAFQSELGTAMQDALSEQELRELHSLTSQISDLTRSLNKEKSKLASICTKKNSLETLLNSNLIRRKNELELQVESGESGMVTANDREEEMQEKKIDLNQATSLVEQNLKFLQTTESKVAEATSLMQKAERSLEDLKLNDIKHNEDLQEATRKAEKILNKRSRLLQKREDTMAAIRDLGTLPITELEKFKDNATKEIVKLLHKCNEKLKAYDHVNKKALDQYVSFSEQRSTLIDRKKELDEGQSSISDLIDVLDKRKDEAILRTFKGVSHHFSEVFKELVPSGNGKMLILRRDSDEMEEEEENSSKTKEAIDTFTGVQIKVNFRGEGDSYLMQQLSGGQKCLVALAFIFAIQRCDPAPFYLFDEIDQALDSTHRAAVASLIHRQAHSEENPVQFITSTFRPEMVTVSDKFYGIGHQNKISNVHRLSKEDALDFIANIMAEEESVLENANQSKRRRSGEV